ncbi:hypothetical protein [Nostoc sp. PA-18-2419]|uniref:hypothetical protein n=1 Tax=Nostoc sp. PA-18-2419 TaxID=2575443 RepID=UPI001108F083|nr:hypothetical protein [Nostoc sp. PA-18-2419]
MVISPFDPIFCFGYVFCPARTATLDINVKAGKGKARLRRIRFSTVKKSTNKPKKEQLQSA